MAKTLLTLICVMLICSSTHAKHVTGRSCLELKQRDVTSSGVYSITPCQSKPEKTILVYCDMQSDGGGWTVIQRRDNYVDQENFTRSWKDYANGFGSLEKDFWLGNDEIHCLTAQHQTTVRFDLEDFEGQTAWAKYSTFSVGDRDKSYKLQVSGYTGNANDSFSQHNEMKFSTVDNDNDIHGDINCAQRYKGGWWYSNCHLVNLNGIYLERNDTSFAVGVNWYGWKGYNQSLKKTELKIRGNGILPRWDIGGPTFKTAAECNSMGGFCVKTGDHCNGMIEILSKSCNDHCTCCIKAPLTCHGVDNHCESMIGGTCRGQCEPNEVNQGLCSAGMGSGTHAQCHCCRKVVEDGQWSSWSVWGSCTKSCGGGSRQRSRQCNNPAPGIGGQYCSGLDKETEVCNSKACVTCSGSDNFCESMIGGTCRGECEPNEMKRGYCRPAQMDNAAPATTMCHCCKKEVVHGHWSSWSVWGSCTKTCGVGSRQRSRQCNKPPPGIGGQYCSGLDKETEVCNSQACDGQWSSWSVWGSCTKSCGVGSRQRTRQCNNPAPGIGGQNCSGSDKETEVCNSQACAGWSRPIKNACIRGHNDKPDRPAASLETCRQLCEKERSFDCKSIEYNTRGTCTLSKANKLSSNTFTNDCHRNLFYQERN